MNARFIFSVVVALIIGGIGGFFVSGLNKKVVPIHEQCQIKFNYINEQLGCEPKQNIRKHEYTAFVFQLKKFIEEEVKNKKVKHVSVYFRDLEYGPTFGIHEQEKFAPASLLKVPVLIAYLNLAEKDPSLFKKKLSYTKVVALVQQPDSIPKLEPNKPYPIDELLSRMIIYSDNLSYWLLINYLTKNYPSESPHIQTIRELGLIYPKSSSESTITVKSYASVFRQLYNSSYLSTEMSEKALGLLSQSKYKNALVAGIPKDIKVAHKFGELEGLPNGEKQLHDCGIVYYVSNPYLLCIMTRGDNFNELNEVIKEVSRKVYAEVDARKY